MWKTHSENDIHFWWVFQIILLVYWRVCGDQTMTNWMGYRFECSMIFNQMAYQLLSIEIDVFFVFVTGCQEEKYGIYNQMMYDVVIQLRRINHNHVVYIYIYISSSSSSSSLLLLFKCSSSTFFSTSCWGLLW